MNAMYMSYCRFEGTLAELRACMSEVYDHVNEEAEYEVSDREINYFRQMVEEFSTFMTDLGITDCYGDLDNAKLDKVCEQMAQSFGEEEEYA